MAGRPRKTATKSAKSTPKTKKTTAKAEVVEEVISDTPVVEEVITEVPVAEETTVETPVVAEEVKAEPVEEEKQAEPKPKRKYTRRAKTAETPVVEEESKPKRKYTKRTKPAETPVESAETPVESAETPVENTSAPKLEAYIQGAGAERSFEELAEIATKLSGVKSPKFVNLYIKPYEHDGVAKVYYVVDKKAGHFNLF